MEYKPSFIDQLDVDYICHHGIKGMHWGIRRFQNPDGSLTSAGKQRYSLNPITRSKQKREERRIAKEQEEERNRIFREKLNDLESRAQKIEYHDYWLNIYEDWDGPSAKEFRKAWDKADTKIYEDDALYDRVAKKAYKYGYDAGTHTATKLEKEFGRDALNRWIDMYFHENTYYHQLTDKDFEQLETEDPVKRFAHLMGEEEMTHI